MSLYDFAVGEFVASSDLDNNYKGNALYVYDTGSDLNGSVSSSGTTTATTTASWALAASDFGNADYVQIDITGLWVGSAPGTASTSTNAAITLTVEELTTSTTIFSRSIISCSGAENHEDRMRLPHFSVVHLLSSTELSDGAEIQISMDLSATRSGSGANSSASYTNDVVTIRGIYGI